MKKQVERFLNESGFSYVRDVRHGRLYTNGVTSVVASRTYKNNRAYNNFISQVKRAMEQKISKDIAVQSEFARKMDQQLPHDASSNVAYRIFSDGAKNKIKKEIRQSKQALKELRLIEPDLEPETKPAKIEPKIEPKKQETIVEKPKEPEVQKEPIVEVKEQEAKRRRFKDEDRVIIWTRIHELMSADLNTDQITNIMRGEGWKMSNGDEFEREYVSTVVSRMKSEKAGITGQLAQLVSESVTPRPPAPPVPTPAPPVPTPIAVVAPAKAPTLATPTSSKLPEYVVGILSAKELSDKQKIQMLCVYAGISLE